jgi:hypothetical protein
VHSCKNKINEHPKSEIIPLPLTGVARKKLIPPGALVDARVLYISIPSEAVNTEELLHLLIVSQLGIGKERTFCPQAEELLASDFRFGTVEQ